MSTFDQLVDSTILYLSGFSSHQDQATWITQSIDASATTIEVNDSSALSRGLCEIGSELIQIDAVDRSGQTATIPPYGRGFRGTTAASHAAGTQITSSPQFPRFAVEQAINETIRSLYPDLYAVYDEFLTAVPTTVNFDLTNQNARHVLRASGEAIGSSGEWIPIRRFELRPFVQGGAQIAIYDQPVPGQKIHVRTAGPAAGLSSGDDFTDSGLPESSQDLVRLGAAYRMVPYLETPLVSGLSAQADLAANMRPVGSGEKLGKYMLGLYRTRLEEERHKQQSENPIRAHYER
jgi:hypothetical protein